MRLFVLTCYFLIPAICVAQVSDFITVKKRNNRTVKSYFPGSPIICETFYGNHFNGYVDAVRNDSVFIKQYDIRQVPTMWGVAKLDTIATYVTGVHYKHIRMMIFKERASLGFIRSGTIFIIGGLGYAALNIINAGYLRQSVKDKDNLEKLGIAGGVAGAGFLLKYLDNRSRRNHKKYKIEYIHMNTPKLRGA
jgi:hypothetical protein